MSKGPGFEMISHFTSFHNQPPFIMINRFAIVVMLGIVVSCTPKKEVSNLITDIPVCGTVQFSDGCSPELDKAISLGIALVHHMTYEEADTVFGKVINADSTCFWGHWGKALTYIHPLWNDPPGEEKLKAGWNLSQRALKHARTDKELLYGKALAGYYENGLQKTEKERLKKFEEGWFTTYKSNTNDLEAKSFYALSLIATADPSDQNFLNQKKAGALAAEVLEIIKDHPGGYHYVIHAYDYPGLTDKALYAAQTYSSIAPELPHAQHMPSHIFTRRGMWTESIQWNAKSAESAKENPVKGATSLHYFHAVDYLVYAYLQKGEDEKAKAAFDEMKRLQGPFQPHGVTAYALSATEGRIYIERQDWKKAAALTLPAPQGFSWDKFPDFQGVNYFATGLGAARSGSTDIAEKCLRKLDSLRPHVKHPYFANQLEIQRNIINAWIAFNRGSKNKATELMKQAADLEWSMQKHAVTPGELLPAREIYADMLLEMNDPKEALVQYEMSLERSPDRLNSIYGAANAAKLSGDGEKARHYYERVVYLTSGADASFAQRKKSMEYLSRL